jgi:membrane protein required for colicin V production
MSYIDIILAVLLIIGLVRGFKNGFFIEVASLLSLVVGLYGAIHFSFFIADWLKTKVEWDAKYIHIVAFAATFIIILMAVSMVGKLVTKMVDAISLGLLNKLAGGIFGAAKIGLILSVIIGLFSKMNDTITFAKKETLENSILYNPVKNFAPTLFPSILEQVKNLKNKHILKNEDDSEEEDTNPQ